MQKQDQTRKNQQVMGRFLFSRTNGRVRHVLAKDPKSLWRKAVALLHIPFFQLFYQSGALYPQNFRSLILDA